MPVAAVVAVGGVTALLVDVDVAARSFIGYRRFRFLKKSQTKGRKLLIEFGYNDHGYKDHGYNDHGYHDNGYNNHGYNDHGYNDHDLTVIDWFSILT